MFIDVKYIIIRRGHMVSTYNQLCPVVFGPGAVNTLADKVREYGGTKALCIYDNGVKAAGISDRIIRVLSEAGIGLVPFDGVLPDAPAETVNRAGKLAQNEKVDIVIGIGGGSSLDTAKAAVVLVDNPLPINNYFISKGVVPKSAVPLILIPTTSGTGSEVSVMAVIHDEETHIKESVLRSASLAIVDPELTLTVPKSVTAMTGFDALSHAIEAYTTNRTNPNADILCLEVMRLVINNLEKAYNDGSNLEARTNLSLASNLAGMAFNDSFLHFGHAVAHELGVVFHMPHGVACAITIPEVIIFASDVAPERVLRIAEALGVLVAVEASADEAGELAANKIRSLMRPLGIKSLQEQGITKEAAMNIAEGAIEHNSFINCALKPVDPPALKVLIGKMYDNYK
jgi:alcohol dehydrogenase class IV